VAELADAHV